jgi:protein involved in polysaccharide export with SLBB domain
MTTSHRPAAGLLILLHAVVASSLTVGAESPARASDGIPVKESDRVLGVGDPVVVSIRDLEAPGKNTLVEVSVNEDGQITLPLLPKPVPAKGLTTEKLQEAVVQAYRKARLFKMLGLR